MSSGHRHVPSVNTLRGRVEAATGVSIAKCYQCGKCAAGCPVGDEMDMPPSRIFRLVQWEIPEMEERALRSEAIWLCLSCETCATRCPQELEIPKALDAIRAESLKRGMVNPKAKKILAFHRSFLASIEREGRLFEVGMVSDYKRRTGDLMKDVTVAPKLFLRGKLGLMPHRIKDRAGVKAIFKRVLGKG